jgi:hypothetical protein
VLAFWVVELQTVWSVTEWGSLIPKEIGFGTSGYPLQPSALSGRHVTRRSCTDCVPAQYLSLYTHGFPAHDRQSYRLDASDGEV